jgi:hypothetical protein
VVHTRQRDTPQPQGKPRLRRKPWQNRIVGEGEEAPDQLLAHPDNFRIHPAHQQDVLSAVLNKVGIVQRVIVNKRTGRMLDGHLRVQMAISEDVPLVPVTYVDLSEHEEALVLATYDAISALAVTDDAKLEELRGLLPEDMRDLATLVWSDPDEGTEVSFTASDKHQVVVECDNETAQHALAERLQAEGYTCRLKG